MIRSTWLFIAILGAFLLSPALVWSQSHEVDLKEQKKEALSSDPHSQQAPQQEPLAVESVERVEEEVEPRQRREPSQLLRRSIYDAGRFSLTFEGAFSQTTSRSEQLAGGTAVDSTFFLRVDSQITLQLINRLEVGLIAGLVSRRLAQELGDAATDVGLALQPLIRYHLPVSPRAAIYAQAAPGFYLGRSTRDVLIDDELLEEEGTRTRAFVLSSGLGVNYRLSEGVQLRFGVGFNGIWGTERIEIEEENIEERLSVSTTNFGTTAGIRYTF